MSLPTEQSDTVRAAVAVLDKLSIKYAIGGSIASSIYGIPRFTHDADITVEPFRGREAEFARHFGDDYYLSVPSIESANRNRTMFNVLHLPSGFKLDFFIRKENTFGQALIARRRAQELSEPGGDQLYLVSPEDIVLLKLEWYRLGGGVSDRQWSDVLGVLRARGDSLDRAYLERSAMGLDVLELLHRAMTEVKR